jgi:hypothetical protein
MRPSPRGEDSATVQMMLTDERQEFELNLGKAVDTLKHDYPDILTEPPGTYSTATRLSSFENTHDPYPLTHAHTLFSLSL